MPRLLVAYGTTDGQTAKICAFLGEVATQLGREVDLVEVGTRPLCPGAYDAVIVAASVHAQGHQRSVWAREHAAELATVPNACISVCLGVLQKETRGAPGPRRHHPALRGSYRLAAERGEGGRGRAQVLGSENIAGRA